MILATRLGDRTLRSADSLGQLLESRNPRIAGVVVDQRSAVGLPAANRAISTAAQAVASLWRGFGVYRGEGVDRQRVTGTWQARLFAGVPNDEESWFDVWEQTERSLTARNNAYWYTPRTAEGQVALVYALNPGDVDVGWDADRNRPRYRFRQAPRAGWSDWVDSRTVFHIRGLNETGCLVDPTPVELHREALAAAIGKTRYEGRFYDRGVQQHIAVTFPQNVTREQAEEWKEMYEANHEGLEGDGVSVFGGGVEVSTIGLSLQDAQYIESMQFSVEELARIFNVHASLLGGGTQGNQKDKPITPEHEQDRWLRYGLGPRLERIEARLMASPTFFGPGSRTYPMFSTDRILRGDLQTEDQIAHQQVQDGRLLVDEWRASKGLPPLPDGLGSIPQIVPVGGAPNPI